MSIEGQGHFFTIYFSGFICFALYLAKISGEGLQDHRSSGSDFSFTFQCQNRTRFKFALSRSGLLANSAVSLGIFEIFLLQECLLSSHPCFI